ncbi:MAG: hypothetical protein MUF65_06970, partial [Rubritepida sp.]|nr:hypothetical protein [Rubritepida sp.]
MGERVDIPRSAAAPLLLAGLLALAACAGPRAPEGAAVGAVASALPGAPVPLPIGVGPPPEVGPPAAAPGGDPVEGLATATVQAAVGAAIGAALPGFGGLLSPITGFAISAARDELRRGGEARPEGADAGEVAAREALRWRTSPERLALCLQAALIQHAGGRLVAAAPPVLAFGVGAALGPGAGARQPLVLSVVARREGAGAFGGWRWASVERERPEGWAARDGARLEAEIGLGIGLLARRILG